MQEIITTVRMAVNALPQGLRTNEPKSTPPSASWLFLRFSFMVPFLPLAVV